MRDNIALDSKAAYLRVLLRDASGRIGTADVPPADLQRLLTDVKVARAR